MREDTGCHEAYVRGLDKLLYVDEKLRILNKVVVQEHRILLDRLTEATEGVSSHYFASLITTNSTFRKNRPRSTKLSLSKSRLIPAQMILTTKPLNRLLTRRRRARNERSYVSQRVDSIEGCAVAKMNAGDFVVARSLQSVSFLLAFCILEVTVGVKVVFLFSGLVKYWHPLHGVHGVEQTDG